MRTENKVILIRHGWSSANFLWEGAALLHALALALLPNFRFRTRRLSPISNLRPSHQGPSPSCGARCEAAHGRQLNFSCRCIRFIPWTFRPTTQGVGAMRNPLSMLLLSGTESLRSRYTRDAGQCVAQLAPYGSKHAVTPSYCPPGTKELGFRLLPAASRGRSTRNANTFHLLLRIGDP